MFFRQLHARDASLSYLFGCSGKGRSVAAEVVADLRRGGAPRHSRFGGLSHTQ